MEQELIDFRLSSEKEEVLVNNENSNAESIEEEQELIDFGLSSEKEVLVNNENSDVETTEEEQEQPRLSLKERLIQTSFKNVLNSVCTKNKIFDMVKTEILPYTDITVNQVDEHKDILTVVFPGLGSIELNFLWQFKRNYTFKAVCHASKKQREELFDILKSGKAIEPDCSIGHIDDNKFIINIFNMTYGKINVHVEETSDGYNIDGTISTSAHSKEDMIEELRQQTKIVNNVDATFNTGMLPVNVTVTFFNGVVVEGVMLEVMNNTLAKLVKIE